MMENQEMLQEIEIQLGDIISFTTDNEYNINNNVNFYVTYVDMDVVNLRPISDSSTTSNSIELRIRGDNNMIYHENDKIVSWELLYRNEFPGFVKQNNLTVGTWLNIEFGVTTPSILITAEIVRVHEDMIELETFPTKQKYYINFDYHGIPKDLKIISIQIRSSPLKESEEQSLKQAQQQQEQQQQLEEGIEENFFIEDLNEDGFEMERRQQRENQRQERARNNDFGLLGQAVNVVTDIINKDRSRLERETNDMFNSIIELEKRKFQEQNMKADEVYMINEAHKKTQRFIQLYNQFSSFDKKDGTVSVNGPRIEDKVLDKPLIQYFQEFKTPLYWILPTVTNNKKVYSFTPNDLSETDQSELHQIYFPILESSISNADEERLEQSIGIIKEYDENLKGIFTPFTKNDAVDEYFIKKSVGNNVTTILKTMTGDNSQCKTVNITIKKRKEEPVENKFDTVKYNTGLPYLERFSTEEQRKNEKITFLDRKVKQTSADQMQLNGFVTLPPKVLQFSRVNLPYTNILVKSNFSDDFFLCWKYFATDLETEYFPVELMETSEEDNEDDQNIIRKNTNGLIPSLKKTFIFNLSKKNQQSTILSLEQQYENGLLNAILFPTQYFDNLKKFISYRQTTSMIDMISFLEPLLIYSENVNFNFYEEAKKFIDESFKKYTEYLLGRQAVFVQLKKMKPQKSFLTELSLTQTISNVDEIEKQYGFTDKEEQPTNTEFFERINEVDFANLYASFIAWSNVQLCSPNVDDIIRSLQVDNEGNEENKDNKEDENKRNKEETLEDLTRKTEAKQQQLKQEIKHAYDYNDLIISTLREIEKNDFMQYNNERYRLSKDVKVNAFVDTAESKILNLILKEKSDVKRNYDIVRFKRHCLREPLVNLGEEDFWYYGKSTDPSVRLLPKLVVELAEVFNRSKEQYEELLLKYTTVNDGNYIDPKTGWRVASMNFKPSFVTTQDENDNDEVDEEQQRKSQKSQPIEVGIGPQMDLSETEVTPEETEWHQIMSTDTSERTKLINQIFKALKSQFEITYISPLQISFVVNETNAYLNNTLKTEMEYDKIVEAQKKKDHNRKFDDYKTYEKESILYAVIALFFIAIQTSIPEVVKRNAITACKFSFAGYPLDETPSNDDGLRYIVCGVAKMQPEGIWKLVKHWNKKIDDRVEKLKAIIYKLLHKDDSNPKKNTFSLNVRNKIDKKREEVISKGMIDKEKQVAKRTPKTQLNKWSNFLPATNNVMSIVYPQPLPFSAWKAKILDDFKMHKPDSQMREISIGETKMLHQSFFIQKLIQEVILKETENANVLLKSLSNNAYVSNACCQTNPPESVLTYFDNESTQKGEITTLNHFVRSTGNYLLKLTRFTEAETLFASIYSQMRFPPLPSEFSEETKLEVFMHYYPFLQDDEINTFMQRDDFLKLSREKQMKELKEAYSKFINEPNEFTRLLQTVSRTNMILSTPDQFKTKDCEENVIDILEPLAASKGQTATEETAVANEQAFAVEQETEVERISTTIYKYLKTPSKENHDHVVNLIYAPRLKDVREKINKSKLFTPVVHDSQDNKKITPNEFYRRIQDIKNMLTRMVKVLPSQLINNAGDLSLDDKRKESKKKSYKMDLRLRGEKPKAFADDLPPLETEQERNEVTIYCSKKFY